MTTTAQREHDRPGTYRVLGTRPIRHDGLDKVTGHARYGADVHMPGLLHGKVLRSPHAHARIRSIDTSKAEALPGVQAVATARDFAVITRSQLSPGNSVRHASICCRRSWGESPCGAWVRWIASSGRDGKKKCGFAAQISIELGKLDPRRAGS